MAASSNSIATRTLRFITMLLNAFWIFFPAILFLLFFIFCFWLLSQGKDIIVDFAENKAHTILGINYTRFIFFVAIAFWVYVSWYSSRIIAYIKRSELEDTIRDVKGVSADQAAAEFDKRRNLFELNDAWLQAFPRLIGNGCFLVLELAVLQSPLLNGVLNSSTAFIAFIAGLILFSLLNMLMKRNATKPWFRPLFNLSIWILLALIIISCFLHLKIVSLLYWLFFLEILFHLIFILFINLRRVDVEKKGEELHKEKEIKATSSLLARGNIFERLMDYLCIPRKESGYFQWFLGISAIAILLYIFIILYLSFARQVGPFPFIILAFGVLLAFGNMIAALSIRYKLNFHFILLVLALSLSIGETHYVRRNKLEQGNKYNARPLLHDYLLAWLKDKKALADSSVKKFDVYFVMANGGASRSGYWTAAVLGRLEDSSIVNNPESRFSDHVFCLSGTSGGGVGVAAFFSLLRDKTGKPGAFYDTSARRYLGKDYFTYAFARMLGPDFFNSIFHFPYMDRAVALERSFEETAREAVKGGYPVPFNDNFSSFLAVKNNGSMYMPILCVNTTRMQDGNPGVVTNLKLDSATFNNRVDVLKLLDSTEDISITSAAILGARFPYLSPAGRIGNNYFVDGGYFDNSGAGVVQEIIRGIINEAKNDYRINGQRGYIYENVKKLHFKVLHITNSPIALDSSNIKAVPPIKNDLLAPILTIVGAYDMQTTVNDGRLINFLKDINSDSVNKADYIQIPLYKDADELKKDSLDPSYAMNWFMSDTTRQRIDNRLKVQPKLNMLIEQMKRK